MVIRSVHALCFVTALGFAMAVGTFATPARAEIVCTQYCYQCGGSCAPEDGDTPVDAPVNCTPSYCCGTSCSGTVNPPPPPTQYPPSCAANTGCITQYVNSATSQCEAADTDGARECYQQNAQCYRDGFSKAGQMLRGTSIPGAWGAKTLLNKVLTRFGIQAVTDAEFADLGGTFFLGFFWSWGSQCDSEQSQCLMLNQQATQSCLNSIRVPSGTCGC